MDPQLSMALPQGFAVGGQQSCSGSEADISITSADCSLKAAPPTAGSKATDAAIRKANMVRANAISERPEYPAEQPMGQARLRSHLIAKPPAWADAGASALIPKIINKSMPFGGELPPCAPALALITGGERYPWPPLIFFVDFKRRTVDQPLISFD
jgi:hypothetical protein